MRAQMSGTIIFIASMYSNFSTANSTPYSASKHAISGTGTYPLNPAID